MKLIRNTVLLSLLLLTFIEFSFNSLRKKQTPAGISPALKRSTDSCLDDFGDLSFRKKRPLALEDGVSQACTASL